MGGEGVGWKGRGEVGAKAIRHLTAWVFPSSSILNDRSSTPKNGTDAVPATAPPVLGTRAKRPSRLMTTEIRVF